LKSSSCCSNKSFGINYLFDVTSTLKLREQSFQVVQDCLQKRLEKSDEYLENYILSLFNNYIKTLKADENFESETPSLIKYKSDHFKLREYCEQYLSINNFYTLAKENFYFKDSEYSFLHKHLLFGFFFQQFNENNNNNYYSLLFYFLSFLRDSKKDKINFFYKILSNLHKELTLKAFIDRVVEYLNFNLIGVLDQIKHLNQDEDNDLMLSAFRKEHKFFFDAEINNIVKSIKSSYDFKDDSEINLILVQEEDFNYFFKK